MEKQTETSIKEFIEIASLARTHLIPPWAEVKTSSYKICEDEARSLLLEVQQELASLEVAAAVKDLAAQELGGRQHDEMGAQQSREGEELKR